MLFALRDRLAIEGAFHLSAQLPMLVRGIFWESSRPVHKPERYRSLDESLEKVSDSIKHVPNGEIEEVRQMLPEPVRKLFPQG